MSTCDVDHPPAYGTEGTNLAAVSDSSVTAPAASGAQATDPGTTAEAGGATLPPGEATLPLTGERTVPGVPEENYWFRRHEVVYQQLLARCAGRVVLEAGSGEGYGANMIADVAEKVIGLDYDQSAVEHVRARYPRIDMRQGNLADLPLPDASVGTVVNFQVIEHLWDQAQFLAECFRVLEPGGELMVSTPNRITFSPGRDTPLNPFHTRELNAAELTELLVEAGFEVELMTGVHHGPRLRELDAKHGGSFIDAQIDRALAGEPWPQDLVADVEAITVDDFALVEADIDASLDLVALARKPAVDR